jgi:hypothetical protein
MDDATRTVTLDIGDGFPVVLSIEHARAIRSALSGISFYGDDDERHQVWVKGEDAPRFGNVGAPVLVWAEIGLREVDADATLPVEDIDFELSEENGAAAKPFSADARFEAALRKALSGLDAEGFDHGA